MGLSTRLLCLALLLALVNSSSLQMQHQKRTANDLGQVYAYAGGLSGVPVFVKDSTAYLGNLSQTGTSGTYVSFTLDNDTHLIATPINGSSADWTASYLAINTTTGAQDSAVLTDASDSAGLTTTGFFVYGSQLSWLSSAGLLQDSWYITPTETDNVWWLKWKAGGNLYDVDGAKVVALKTKQG